MTAPVVYLVPCIECGRERVVHVAHEASIWQAWQQPCLWCAMSDYRARWMLGVGQGVAS